jgi:nitroreductase
MNEVMRAIRERRSIRNYQDSEISEDLVRALLEAVQWSPSWANTQCWEIVVVRDPSVKERLQQTVPTLNPGYKSIVAAPVILALCARKGTSGYFKNAVTTKFGDWFMFDLGVAAQSICLAAHALGLGTLIVGLYDQNKAGEILKLPEGVEQVALITIGYPSKVPSAPKRKDIPEFTHHNEF